MCLYFEDAFHIDNFGSGGLKSSRDIRQIGYLEIASRNTLE